MSFLDEDELDSIKGNVKTNIKKEIKKDNKEENISIDYEMLPEDELVSIVRESSLNPEQYQNFTEKNYPNSLNFYDFEVFLYDWMVVIINPVEKIRTVIINDRKALKRYYNEHKEEIWVGYNSRNYDTYILKSLLLDMNPKEVNDDIISRGMKGWQISKEFRNKKLYSYDIFQDTGLKTLEAFMGNDIKETSVPFDLPRKLNAKEIRETMKYCIHDVEQTIEVFLRTKSEFDAHIDLINTFELPLNMINLTKAQLTANIIGCERVERDDEFDLEFVKCLHINKYSYVVDWFKDRKNRNYKSSLETTICGIPHQFGWGGLHGAPDKPIHIKGRIFHVDVTSYYPSIMIEYDFLTRNCKDKSKFKEIYDKRVELKKAGKNKEQAPYKIILNSTFGICKDKHSLAFDPLMANNVCVNGQLMLLDLLEHLEGYAEIIQSNTDGIILKVEDNDEAVEKMKNICQRWMNRTKMRLGFDEITEIWQGDVNNYIFKFANGSYERKGAYVKELNDLDNDLPIINKAIVDYLTKNIEPEETINNCNELKMFQKVVKVSGNYKYAFHNGEKLSDKTFRVFASKDKNDSSIGRCKIEGGTVEKFANTSDHSFICNDDVNNIPMSIKLDRKYYINMAKDRIEKKFGIPMIQTGGLF